MATVASARSSTALAIEPMSTRGTVSTGVATRHHEVPSAVAYEDLVDKAVSQAQ